MILDRTFTVKEASASKTLKRGDIIFARVLPLGGQTIIVGLAPLVIPPNYHYRLLDLRDGLREQMKKFRRELDAEFLLAFDTEIREIYFDLAEAVSNPALPQLRNTDGDPLAFVKLYFEIDCAPQEAFDRLKSLSLPEFQDDLEDMVHDSEGNLRKVSFPWQKEGNRTHKHWTNTILGRVTIDGSELTAEVNSAKRAEKIQAEITKRLGEAVTYKRSVYESVEQKLAEAKNRPDAQSPNRSKEGAQDLESRPEVQAFLKEHMKAHWEAWYNEPVPALQNKTPIEAAKTSAGRERLEALLGEFERRSEILPQPELRADIAAIRKRLGL